MCMLSPPAKRVQYEQASSLMGLYLEAVALQQLLKQQLRQVDIDAGAVAQLLAHHPPGIRIGLLEAGRVHQARVEPELVGRGHQHKQGRQRIPTAALQASICAQHRARNADKAES